MVKPIPRELSDMLQKADSRCKLPPDLLALLLALKQQIEEDTVLQDHLTGWCRSLPRLIEQDAMPKAWDQLVAYLKEHGHE
jgi:hypothetical protein